MYKLLISTVEDLNHCVLFVVKQNWVWDWPNASKEKERSLLDTDLKVFFSVADQEKTIRGFWYLFFRTNI